MSITEIPTQNGLALVWVDPDRGLDAIVSSQGEVSVVRHGGPAAEAETIVPRPEGYCVHGTYTGGCGIDWLCGACESGEDDPTLDEQADWALSSYTRHVLRHVSFLLKFGATLAELNPALASNVVADVTRDARRSAVELRSIARERRTVARWGCGRHELESFATDAYRTWERRQPPSTDFDRRYTEIDEVHEYGYVPD